MASARARKEDGESRRSRGFVAAKGSGAGRKDTMLDALPVDRAMVDGRCVASPPPGVSVSTERPLRCVIRPPAPPALDDERAVPTSLKWSEPPARAAAFCGEVPSGSSKHRVPGMRPLRGLDRPEDTWST